MCNAALVDQDVQLIVAELYQSAVDIEKLVVFAGGLHLDASLFERGDDGGVVFEYLKRTFAARKAHQGCLAAVYQIVR